MGTRNQDRGRGIAAFTGICAVAASGLALSMLSGCFLDRDDEDCPYSHRQPPRASDNVAQTPGFRSAGDVAVGARLA